MPAIVRPLGRARRSAASPRAGPSFPSGMNFIDILVAFHVFSSQQECLDARTSVAA